MGKKLFVGSLSFGATEDSLRESFSTCGQVESVSIISDRDTGRSKGFGFVEMSSDDEAQAAISQLNGAEIDGRPIVVNEARPRSPQGPGGGRGGNNRGFQNRGRRSF